MKFKTKDLIAQVDKKIDEEIAAAEQRTRDEAQVVADEKEAWFANAEQWTLFANRIKDKIRKGRPILYSDVPAPLRMRYGTELRFFNEPKPKKHEPKVAHLRSLKATLESITDEEVTTSGLKEIGFKEIRFIFS